MPGDRQLLSILTRPGPASGSFSEKKSTARQLLYRGRGQGGAYGGSGRTRRSRIDLLIAFDVAKAPGNREIGRLRHRLAAKRRGRERFFNGAVFNVLAAALVSGRGGTGHRRSGFLLAGDHRVYDARNGGAHQRRYPE